MRVHDVARRDVCRWIARCPRLAGATDAGLLGGHQQVERKTEECDLVPGVVGLAYNESQIQVEIKGGCYEAATDAGILEESKAEARVESKAKYSLACARTTNEIHQKSLTIPPF
jgi:hypothetical protein